MSVITLRKAIPEDLPILLQFEQGIIEAERPFDVTIKKTPISYYDLSKIINDTNCEIVVALDGSKIVGSGFVSINVARHYLNHENYANLRFMFTIPEYRGKGINTLIINYLKEWAASRGLSEVRLTVYQDNIAAIKAYEKVGFKKHIIEMRLV
mgnify:FL=1|tara:strand:- start:75983 stop:76441 length:459 start_codon:yes stop_codon:yes gene_type:complete